MLQIDPCFKNFECFKSRCMFRPLRQHCLQNLMLHPVPSQSQDETHTFKSNLETNLDVLSPNYTFRTVMIVISM